jgi:lipoyl-dependent peroxiredoxin
MLKANTDTGPASARCSIQQALVAWGHTVRKGRGMAESTAHAQWQGDLIDGAGTIDRVGSGTFGPLDVSWAARTGEEAGKTTPEELLAAAHASCYSMALSNILGKQGAPPTNLSTSATVTFVPGTGITTSAIEVEGTVPGIDQAAFQQAAEEARDGCPVSKALQGNVELSVVARLVA